MYEKSAFVFWMTLILYIITLCTVSYVGVYLTYVAIPLIVISGLIMMIAKPQPKTQQVMESTSSAIKEVNKTTNDFLDKMTSSLEQFNEKTALIKKRTKSLNEKKQSLKMSKIEPEIELKYETNQSRKNELKTIVLNIEKNILDIEMKIDQIKKECELEIAHKFQNKA